jgi:ABC-2 type transport system ATP-binding protein
LVRRLEIQGWWNKEDQTSKGMAQKIQFVVCVLHKPKLLIFDEPFLVLINSKCIKIKILALRVKRHSIFSQLTHYG